eukprot:997692-Pyramimonas_sp.AAC.1
MEGAALPPQPRASGAGTGGKLRLEPKWLRAPEADEHVWHHLGCLSVSVGAGQFGMLYRIEPFDLFILIQSDIAILVLGASHSTI